MKKGIIAAGLFSVFVITILLTLLSFYPYITKAESTPSASAESDIKIDVGSIIALTVANCDNSPNDKLVLSVTPTPTGTFKSDCQNVTVSTNAPGYTLSAKANNSHPDLSSGAITNSLIYQNPLPLNLSQPPTIASTTNQISNPQTIQPNSWGFAVSSTTTNLTDTPAANFDPTYTANNSNNKYARLLTTDTTIYTTNDAQTDSDIFNFWYAVNLNHSVLAGLYQTTVTYSAVTNEIPEPTPPCIGEVICFTVNAGTTGTYNIPTSGTVANMNHTYNWIVYVNGRRTTNCPKGNCTGTSNTSTPGANGIALTGLPVGTSQIRIIPNGTPTPGWGNAFGHSPVTTGTANTSTNKQKLISLDAPLTTMAFSPKTTESTTNASYMFANMFRSCGNLTTSATIIDTYKLPNTITNLSYFLSYTHSGNTQLQSPVDLSLLSGWLNSNNTVINLSYFSQSTHIENTALKTSLDLSPLSGWFNNNNSVRDISYFLFETHSRISIQSTPIILPSWSFTGVTNLSYFLCNTHFRNNNKLIPIDLSPLKNWLNANNTVTDLSNFLYYTHSGDGTNYYSTLSAPLNLSPLAGWFNANNSIINMSNFLRGVHAYNNRLPVPINLSPLAGWFYKNSSITDLSNFLYIVHYAGDYIMTNPVSLTPTQEWFADNRLFSNLINFLAQAHSTTSASPGYTALGLSGQIIFPNWLKTVKQGTTPEDAIPIWEVSGAFYYTYNAYFVKSNDSGEPRFMDGTVLSSIGEPNSNRQTYRNRTGLTLQLQNINWQ